MRTMVAGHVCLDLIPRHERAAEVSPGRLFEVGPLTLRAGGCVANTGLDLAALGAAVRLDADVGSDELGQLLSALLRAPDVDSAAIRQRPGCRTSYSIVVQSPGVDRMFWHHVGANANFDGSKVDLGDVDLLHLGYPTHLPRLYEDAGDPFVALLGRARSEGVVTSVDIATVDAASPAARCDWDALLRRSLPSVDVFAPSVDDLASVLGAQRSAREWAAQLVAAGVGVAMVKSGEAGLFLHTAGSARLEQAGTALARVARRWCDQVLWVPPRAVNVVSTCGAGDAAVAGLLYGITTGMTPSQALDAAAAAAAARLGRFGRLPRFDDLSVTAG